MELRFIFICNEGGEPKEREANLHGILPDRYILSVPKGKNSPALLADFLDRCPGINVRGIDKTHPDADIITFRTDGLYKSEVVQEVCNGINDVFDTDIHIQRMCCTPAPLEENNP